MKMCREKCVLLYYTECLLSGLTTCLATGPTGHRESAVELMQLQYHTKSTKGDVMYVVIIYIQSSILCCVSHNNIQ